MLDIEDSLYTLSTALTFLDGQINSIQYLWWKTHLPTSSLYLLWGFLVFLHNVFFFFVKWRKWRNNKCLIFRRYWRGDTASVLTTLSFKQIPTLHVFIERVCWKGWIQSCYFPDFATVWMALIQSLRSSDVAAWR